MRPSRDDRRPALAAAIAGNALPVVGVALLDWSLAAVVVLYWLELGALLWWASVRALLAQRPSELPADLLLVGAARRKRGGPTLPRTGFTVQVQHLPVLAALVPVLVVLWLFTGALAVGGLAGATPGEGIALGDEAATTVLLGALGVFVSRGVATARYVLDGDYTDVNAQLALRSALWPILVTGLALGAAGAAATASDAGVVLMVAIVAVKFAFDLVDVYRDRLRAFDEASVLSFGWATDPPAWTPVDGALDGPVETVRPRRLAVLASGVARGCSRFGPLFLVVLFSLLSAALLVVGAVDAALFVGTGATAILLLFGTAGALDHAIRYGTVEYRVAGDVVGHDRLLGEPLWRLPAWRVAGATVERTLADRLFGTVTVVVDTGEEEVRLVHLPDAAAVGASAA